MAYTAGRCLIGELLDKRGWSQRELARISSVPKTNISDYIKGKYKISIVHAKNVADALDCTIEDLYEWIPIDSESPDRPG